MRRAAETVVKGAVDLMAGKVSDSTLQVSGWPSGTRALTWSAAAGCMSPSAVVQPQALTPGPAPRGRGA